MFVINEIETRRFGVICARLDAQVGAFPDLTEVNKAAKAQGVAMISTRVDVSTLGRVHALEADGYRLMDTLVYYQRETDQPPQLQAPAGVTIRRATPDDAKAVGRVARDSFSGYFGHYHADPRLDNGLADEAYGEWAERSVANASEQNPVLVAIRDARVLGFAANRINAVDEIEIVLNAVHPSEHGGGVYSSLVVNSLQIGEELYVRRMIISTQINNYRVQRVWVRLGFVHARSFYTFHKWFSDC